MTKIKTKKSNCCHAPVTIGGMPDFIGDNYICTVYYICTKCAKPCDLQIKVRKTWKRSPITQIISDKRKKLIDKVNAKERDDIE